MNDDIKSMIKSRRDERYHGSAFEKRDPRLDDARFGAAVERSVGNVANDGVMSQEEYDDAVNDAIRTNRQANEGERVGYNWEDDRLMVHNMRDPDQKEAIGGTRSDTRNVGIPKKQPTLEEIPGKARDYADFLLDKSPDVNFGDFYDNRQALLDGGYTEDDLQKFEEIYERLYNTKHQTLCNARSNARRIRGTQMGWEPDEW